MTTLMVHEPGTPPALFVARQARLLPALLADVFILGTQLDHRSHRIEAEEAAHRA